MAYYCCLPPPKPSGLHLLSLNYSSRARFLLPYGFLEISSSARRDGTLKSRAMQSTGGGGTKPTQGTASSNTGSTQSGNASFNLSSIRSWITCTFSSVFFTGVPLCKRILIEHERLVEKILEITETVEKVAEVTEELSSGLAESLPAGNMKELALKVEKMADVVDKSAEKAEALVQEVGDMKEMLEKLAEPILGGEVAVQVTTSPSSHLKKAG